MASSGSIWWTTKEISRGSLKTVSLADGREAAREIRRKIAEGNDPVAERRQEQLTAPTVREANEMVHEEHEKAWKNGKHQN